MTERIIDISETGLFIRAENKLLVIENKGEVKAQIPFAEIAALVVSNPAVSFTNSALSGLAEEGAIVVISDSKHLPSAMLLPLRCHSTQTERIAIQVNALLPCKKNAWKQIVNAKIVNQGKCLLKIHGKDYGLLEIAKNVRSGDKDNLEAIAARRYWTALFQEDSFSRNPDGDDQNTLLNYGYAILHAMGARALCASGLHPGIGINHHNKYNPFCLASDIIEPFRPIVDKAVYDIINENRNATFQLNKDLKSKIITALLGKVIMDGQSITLFLALSKLSSSLVKVLSRNEEKLALPDEIFPVFDETL